MEAHKRGVKVQVILDKSQRTEKYSSATFFQNVGIPTFMDDIHGLARNKVMVIDGRVVITDSFTSRRRRKSPTPRTFWSYGTLIWRRSMRRTGRSTWSIRCLTNGK